MSEPLNRRWSLHLDDELIVLAPWPGQRDIRMTAQRVHVMIDDLKKALDGTLWDGDRVVIHTQR